MAIRYFLTAPLLAQVGAFATRDPLRKYLAGVWVRPLPDSTAVLTASDGKALMAAHDRAARLHPDQKPFLLTALGGVNEKRTNYAIGRGTDTYIRLPDEPIIAGTVPVRLYGYADLMTSTAPAESWPDATIESDWRGAPDSIEDMWLTATSDLFPQHIHLFPTAPDDVRMLPKREIGEMLVVYRMEIPGVERFVRIGKLTVTGRKPAAREVKNTLQSMEFAINGGGAPASVSFRHRPELFGLIVPIPGRILPASPGHPPPWLGHPSSARAD